jgi:pullulanase
VASAASAASVPPVPPRTLRIHYKRSDDDYARWGLHTWGDVAAETEWAAPLMARDGAHGVFWDVALGGADGNGSVQFIVHAGELVDARGAVELVTGNEAWIVSGASGVFAAPPDPATLCRGDLGAARAYWLDDDVLATPLDGAAHTFTLHASQAAGLTLSAADGVAGADLPPVPLVVDHAGLPPQVVAKFPHLAGLTCLRLAAAAPRLLLLKCQLALTARAAADGSVADATGVQVAGALDALCAYDGPLGMARAGADVTLRVWAPSAQRVQLLLFDAPEGSSGAEVLEMHEGARGVWAATGAQAAWSGRYYQYRVTAFHPSTGRMETCDATDPYALALSANGTRVQVCDLGARELKPPGWDTLGSRKPPLADHVDAVLYELHTRDFSVADATVPPAERGTFAAFTRVRPPTPHNAPARLRVLPLRPRALTPLRAAAQRARSAASQDCAGTRHLASLAAAGVTHVHLLPVYDFGSVNERREQWREPAAPGGAPLSSFPPDSEVQQAAVTAVADSDGYNWCARR